jgi:hypothetical protein
MAETNECRWIIGSIVQRVAEDERLDRRLLVDDVRGNERRRAEPSLIIPK